MLFENSWLRRQDGHETAMAGCWQTTWPSDHRSPNGLPAPRDDRHQRPLVESPPTGPPAPIRSRARPSASLVTLAAGVPAAIAAATALPPSVQGSAQPEHQLLAALKACEDAADGAHVRAVHAQERPGEVQAAPDRHADPCARRGRWHLVWQRWRDHPQIPDVNRPYDEGRCGCADGLLRQGPAPRDPVSPAHEAPGAEAPEGGASAVRRTTTCAPASGLAGAWVPKGGRHRRPQRCARSRTQARVRRGDRPYVIGLKASGAQMAEFMRVSDAGPPRGGHRPFATASARTALRCSRLA